MKEYSVMVLHCMATKINVCANSKEEAEQKVRDIDRETNAVSKSKDMRFYASYKAFNPDEKNETEEKCDCETDDVEEDCLFEELY